MLVCNVRSGSLMDARCLGVEGTANGRWLPVPPVERERVERMGFGERRRGARRWMARLAAVRRAEVVDRTVPGTHIGRDGR